jgi:uncharacterized repeat protein (TIGR02543 family)
LFAGCIDVDLNTQVEASWTPGGSITTEYSGAPAAVDCKISPPAGGCESYPLPLQPANLNTAFAAHADTGYVFEGWSGNCTQWDLNDATNTCTVAGGEVAKKIKAHFKPADYTCNFTKIDAAGAALPADAGEWACVRDNNTGRLWEAKTSDGGRHDAGWTFSWYANALKSDLFTAIQEVGIMDGGTCAAGSRCDTADYIRIVRSEKLCNALGWRLPTLQELNSLVIPSQIGSSPVVDAQFFPDAAAGASYWSTQLSVDGGVNAMTSMRHDNGASSSDAIEGGSAVPHAVRLVR